MNQESSYGNQKADYGSLFAQIDFNEMTEAERQAQIRIRQQEYIASKVERKRQMVRQRRLEFPPSSSSSGDSSDNQNSPAQISSESQTEKQKQSEQQSHSKTKNQISCDSIEKIPANSFKKGEQWVKDVIVFQNGKLSISDASFDIKVFTKVKIMSLSTQGYPYRIKINIDNTENLFSPAFTSSEQKNGLLINYYSFARIIQQFLTASNCRLLKPSTQKIPGVPEPIIHNSLIYGKLIKKSQVLGKWEERFVVINKKGLFSYRRFNEKHSMQVLNGEISSIWTRFQIHDQMLVVKLMNNMRKIELGLPFTELLCSDCWLYRLFGIMNKK